MPTGTITDANISGLVSNSVLAGEAASSTLSGSTKSTPLTGTVNAAGATIEVALEWVVISTEQPAADSVAIINLVNDAEIAFMEKDWEDKE